MDDIAIAPSIDTRHFMNRRNILKGIAIGTNQDYDWFVENGPFYPIGPHDVGLIPWLIDDHGHLYFPSGNVEQN